MLRRTLATAEEDFRRCVLSVHTYIENHTGTEGLRWQGVNVRAGWGDERLTGPITPPGSLYSPLVNYMHQQQYAK